MRRWTGRRVSLVRLLVTALLLFTVVPALVVAYVLNRAGTAAVEQMAGDILAQVADRLQIQAESHLRGAHAVLDGLVSREATTAQTQQARRWLRELDRFEPMAVALARQHPDVRMIRAANLHGEYRAVEAQDDGLRVSERRTGEPALRMYLASQAGDRSRPLSGRPVAYEPRTRLWYQAAMRQRERVFTPPMVSPEHRQLVTTLAQPVFDDDGGAAGVLSVQLMLGELAERLRVQRISAFGAAYITDEQGLLVASSAGDALFNGTGETAQRLRPAQSVNLRIQAADAALLAAAAHRATDSVAVHTALQRLPHGEDTLMLVQRPFGQSLGLNWTLVVVAPESDFMGAISQARQVATGLLLAVLAIGALAAALFARRVGGRLARLGVAAGDIGRGGVPDIDQSTRIREVHELSRLLHDSAGQLQAYRTQVEEDARALARANDELETRVAERTRDLEASREEALAAARAKAAFLATMSHEIRTPLNGVVGMSALLAETSLDAEQRDFLQTIRVSSDQLLAVINDILDFSKIESGRLELEAEPLSLRTVIEEACDIGAPRAREKGLELIIDLPEPANGGPPPAIRGDVTRLRQVLINLINNAVKFTDRGEVAVHVRRLEPADAAGMPTIEFRVTDTGIGIPPERVGALFDAFTQVDASTTRRFGGTGLGLAICKRLVGLMGGRIGVDSVAGQGSSFWFTLQAPAAELPQALSPVGTEALTHSRVLVVDDHPANVRILRRQLQMWGMEVMTAESAQEALDILSGQKLPDIVITDMHMPGMDGIAFTREMRALPGAADLPVVLLSSGFLPANDANASLFQARLLKPARQGQLFDTLSRCLSSEPGARPAAASLPDARRGVTVLAVDDNAVNLKVACAMLQRLGYDTLTALDGQQALDRVNERLSAGQPLGAVLMDVNMPLLDGLEATRLIRQAWGPKAPPIIALTAAASADDRARCEAAGMQDYLTKPLAVTDLAQTLDRWIMAAAPPPPAPADAAPQASGPQAPAEAALMDFSRLAEFREFDDDSLSMTREVAGLFLADVPERLAAIERSVAAADAAALARAAHALKGAASNVGANALALACTGLESDARTLQALPADVALRLQALHGLWQLTRQSMEQWLAQPPSP